MEKNKCFITKVYDNEEEEKKKILPTKFDYLFIKFAAKYHIDWLLLKSICYIESRFNPKAFNMPEGAKGLFQIRKIACQDVNCDYERLFESSYNTETACKYLRKLFYDYKLYSWLKVVCGYNLGIGSLNKIIYKYKVVWFNNIPNIDYVNKVYKVYEILKGGD